MPNFRRDIGDAGEEIAARWLEQRGFVILARNVQASHKETDLICRDGGVIVFVEVKSGRSDEYGHPVYRVTRKKRRALISAARRWIAGQAAEPAGYRFDVISVITDTDPPTVEHLPSAFSADEF